MNGLGAALAELRAIGETETRQTDLVICPPATLLNRAVEATSGSALAIGGQDCHSAKSGAHTGDVSSEMLADCGASHVLVGHSERRTDHNETDGDIHSKTEAAWGAGLVAIICLGESLEERQNGDTLDVIGAQLDASMPEAATAANTVIAYEPIWAIGTGLVPELEQIGEVHSFLRARLVARLGETEGNAIRILYGGSVKPANASDIFAVADVDGALVGGASLKASDFKAIVAALDAA